MAEYGSLTYYTRINPETGTGYPVESRQRIFISYKKSDALATGLCHHLRDMILEAVDCAVWYDSSLTPGEDYDREIETAIRDCNAVVLVVTDHILESAYVWEREIPLAKKYQKKIIPVDATQSMDHYGEIEKRLGHVQICSWKANSEEGRLKFKADFTRAIQKYVLNADLLMKVEQCFAVGKQDLSIRHLSLEDRYHIGLGYLKGIGTAVNIPKAEKILKSVICYAESDGELEQIKEDAQEYLVAWYENQIIYALLEGDRDLVFDYERRGMELNVDLLRTMAWSCFHSVKREFMKDQPKTTVLSTGIRLIRLCIIYHFEQTEFSEKSLSEVKDMAADLSVHLLPLFLTVKDPKAKITYVLYFCKFCNNCIFLLNNWEKFAKDGTLDKAVAVAREQFIKPFQAYLKAEVPFSVFRNTDDPVLAKAYFTRCVVYLLKICIGIGDEPCFILGQLFCEGKLVERNDYLADALLLYVCVLNPDRREEAQRVLQHSVNSKLTLYPREFIPKDSALADLERRGELVIDGMHFYLVKPKKFRMYLMRDAEVLYEFPVWEGCGDISTFQMEYHEAEGYLEIMNYEMTHYDSDTRRTRLRIYELDGEELPCEKDVLPALEGRHFLPVR